MRKKRIAICDLLACWPPDAGAFVDMVNVAQRLAAHADVTVLLPRIERFFAVPTPVDLVLKRFTRFYMRGVMEGEFPFRIVHIPFTGATFGPGAISARYRRALQAIEPDKVFIANGWHLKANLARDLADYHPILRIYAHEMLCPKADGWFFRRGRLCQRDFLKHPVADYLRCTACATAFYAGFPAARWVQEYVRSGAFGPGYPHLVKEAMGTASRIIVYNEWTAARVRPYNAAVSVIPSGVDLGLFHPRTESPRNREEVVVIIPGRVKDLHKGREFLARILETMAVRRPSMKFHITGVKPAFQGPNVVDAGWLKPSELPDFYRNGDLALVPSLWPEPQGIVAVEALATGLPLLATRVGGLADLVQEGRNGFLVEPGDIEGAAGLLCRLHDDPALRAQLGRGAREECQARFDWDAIFENHYRNLFEV